MTRSHNKKIRMRQFVKMSAEERLDDREAFYTFQASLGVKKYERKLETLKNSWLYKRISIIKADRALNESIRSLPYFRDVTREEAESYVQNGEYLVRPSSMAGYYVFTIRQNNGICLNILFNYRGRQLVTYYTENGVVKTGGMYNSLEDFLQNQGLN